MPVSLLAQKSGVVAEAVPRLRTCPAGEFPLCFCRQPVARTRPLCEIVLSGLFDKRANARPFRSVCCKNALGCIEPSHLFNGVLIGGFSIDLVLPAARSRKIARVVTHHSLVLCLRYLVDPHEESDSIPLGVVVFSIGWASDLSLSAALHHEFSARQEPRASSRSRLM